MIIYRVNPFDSNVTIYSPDNPLRNGKSIKAIHAFDSNLSISNLEKKCWENDPKVIRYEAESCQNLLEQWSTSPHPRMILFSSHYDEDIHKLFSFSLTKNEFTNHDLIKIAESTTENRALFFFNCCNTGNIPHQGYANVFSKLYPKYALGFITTGFELRSIDAGYFTDKFYDIFMQENKMILEAFVKTKNFLIFQDDNKRYSAFGYMLWFVRPDLVYSQQPILRKYKKNVTYGKNKKGK